MGNVGSEREAAAPSVVELSDMLGRSAVAWDLIRKQIAERFGPTDEGWVFGGRKHGWSLRLRHKKRSILYLTPQPGSFRVGIAFSAAAVQAAMSSELPGPIKETVAAAPAFPEGRGVRLCVSTLEEAAVVLELANLKMTN